jgi:ribosomal protein L21
LVRGRSGRRQHAHGLATALGAEGHRTRDEGEQRVVAAAADTVTSDAAALAKVTVTGEIVGHGKGPKIRIHKFKNKTGYHKRQGHRQHLTDVVVRDITKG